MEPKETNVFFFLLETDWKPAFLLVSFWSFFFLSLGWNSLGIAVLLLAWLGCNGIYSWRGRKSDLETKNGKKKKEKKCKRIRKLKNELFLSIIIVATYRQWHKLLRLLLCKWEQLELNQQSSLDINNYGGFIHKQKMSSFLAVYMRLLSFNPTWRAYRLVFSSSSSSSSVGESLCSVCGHATVKESRFFWRKTDISCLPPLGSIQEFLFLFVCLFVGGGGGVGLCPDSCSNK